MPVYEQHPTGVQKVSLNETAAPTRLLLCLTLGIRRASSPQTLFVLALNLQPFVVKDLSANSAARREMPFPRLPGASPGANCRAPRRQSLSSPQQPPCRRPAKPSRAGAQSCQDSSMLRVLRGSVLSRDRRRAPAHHLGCALCAEPLKTQKNGLKLPATPLRKIKIDQNRPNAALIWRSG